MYTQQHFLLLYPAKLISIPSWGLSRKKNKTYFIFKGTKWATTSFKIAKSTFETKGIKIKNEMMIV
jgi:hypothetical protein